METTETIHADDRLSSHFRAREVFGTNLAIAGPVQIYLARHLAVELLEPLRYAIGSPLIVTNGMRTLADTKRLEREGYRPSYRSDHSFGLPWNPIGVGAVDLFKTMHDSSTGRVKPARMTEYDYDIACDLFFGEDNRFSNQIGQVIWYPERGHMHVSNAKHVLFSGAAVRALRLSKARRHYIQREG